MSKYSLKDTDWYVMYQAQWQKGSIVSYEALLRNATNEEVFPRALFESQSREMQLQITLALVYEVCEVIQKIQRPIAFNLPARLLDELFITEVLECLKSMPKGFLRCEVVEDEVLKSSQLPYIQQFVKAGGEMVIDDLVEKFSEENFTLLITNNIQCIVKIEMKPEYADLVSEYQSRGYIIIQEGEHIDLDSNDILQSNQLSKAQRLVL